MTTGQKTTLSLVETGGSLFQSAQYNNGTPLPALGGLPGLDRIGAGTAEMAERAGADTLTPKEIDVLRLIAGGHANKEIAARLSITEETVKRRVKNILSKLGANDRTHAAMIGVKRGIITL